MFLTPDVNTTSYGTENAQLTITMQDYPTITLTKNFKVTKLAYLPLQIPDYKYVISQSTITIPLPDFTVLPEDFSLKDCLISYAAYLN